MASDLNLLRPRHPPAAPSISTNMPENTNTKKIVADGLAESKHLLHQASSTLLELWPNLPPWRQDNEHIHSGFRPLSNSYRACLRSCFSVHNETGNILSHFLATIWMLALPVIYYPSAKERYPTASADDWVLFGLFFLGGALCFALSTAYHALTNHSRAVHDVCLKLDLLGIVTVTAGCFPPGVWYTFPCVARETKMFWIGVCLLPVFCFLKGFGSSPQIFFFFLVFGFY